jgi:hypothetical protein
MAPINKNTPISVSILKDIPKKKISYEENKWQDAKTTKKLKDLNVKKINKIAA